jgi:hypothetical protein
MLSSAKKLGKCLSRIEGAMEARAFMPNYKKRDITVLASEWLD